MSTNTSNNIMLTNTSNNIMLTNTSYIYYIYLKGELNEPGRKAQT